MGRPSEREVEDQIAKCVEQMAKGGSRWPGMSYEEGVDAALRWMNGETTDKPMDDE